MLVCERVPVALDTLRAAPHRHRRGQAGMPVEHRAAGVEGENLYVFHGSSAVTHPRGRYDEVGDDQPQTLVFLRQQQFPQRMERRAGRSLVP